MFDVVLGKRRDLKKLKVKLPFIITWNFDLWKLCGGQPPLEKIAKFSKKLLARNLAVKIEKIIFQKEIKNFERFAGITSFPKER